MMNQFSAYHKTPKIRTPEVVAVIILKFEQYGFIIQYCVQKM